MHKPEITAILLQKQLFEHCKEHGLPILTMVGIVSEQSIARAYTDLEGPVRESFRSAVAPILYPNSN